MTSRHYWPAPLPLGIDLLAVVCVVCHQPLVPTSAAGEWPRRITEYANREDCPGNGLDHMEDQHQSQDQVRDPEDTMPAQGWRELPPGFRSGAFSGLHAYPGPHLYQCMVSWNPSRVCSDPGCGCPCHHPDYSDAGRFPAPRKDTTMAPVEIGHAEVRMDYGHAAERGEMIDHLTGLDPAKLVEELEGRPVKDLRELHHNAAGTEAWHQQGARDARNLSQAIGRLLRSVGDEIDPQTDQAGPSMGTLR